jgi:hypothetical protein
MKRGSTQPRAGAPPNCFARQKTGSCASKRPYGGSGNLESLTSNNGTEPTTRSGWIPSEEM